MQKKVRMAKSVEDWNGLRYGFLLILSAFNFKL